MKDLFVPIDQAGRLVLPKDVRDELAIKPGDVFKITIAGTTVTLTPKKATAGFVKKGKALVFSTSGTELLHGDTVTNLVESIRSEQAFSHAEKLPSKKQKR